MSTLKATEIGGRRGLAGLLADFEWDGCPEDESVRRGIYMSAVDERLRAALEESERDQFRRDMRRITAKAITAFIAILIWEAGQTYALGETSQRETYRDTGANIGVCPGDVIGFPKDFGALSWGGGEISSSKLLIHERNHF